MTLGFEARKGELLRLKQKYAADLSVNKRGTEMGISNKKLEKAIMDDKR